MKNGALLFTENHPFESLSGAAGGLETLYHGGGDGSAKGDRTLDTLEREYIGARIHWSENGNGSSSHCACTAAKVNLRVSLNVADALLRAGHRVSNWTAQDSLFRALCQENGRMLDGITTST
jgi:hypothetical protein